MAEKTEYTRLGLVYGSETQGNAYYASSAAVAEKEELQVLPTASPPRESRWAKVLSPRYAQGRRIRRALYSAILIFMVIIWIAVVLTFTNRALLQQKAALNSDLNSKKAQGKFSDSNVRAHGRQTKFAKSGMADGHERTPQEVVR
jgi:hypothetical protein